MSSSKVAVAIPVRDEEERIAPCLTALARQRRVPDAVVLMLNNCGDDTEAVARAMGAGLPFELNIISRYFPPHQANAGHARRLAMNVAARIAGPKGILLTTDADAIVPGDWVSRNLEDLCAGADVVCGRAILDPVEAEMIPAHLHADDALECQLITLLDDLAWLLDPEPHDPPPRHTEASGASCAVSVAAYHRVGGVPAIASGEDRAFVRALWVMDARVRHDPAIRVTVSGRTEGRARWGMADTIRRRMIQQDEFADDIAEPALDAFRRYSLRRCARLAWRHAVDAGLADDLMLPRSSVTAALSEQYFGWAWSRLENASPVLRRHRVRFTELPAEIATARALRGQLIVPETLTAD